MRGGRNGGGGGIAGGGTPIPAGGTLIPAGGTPTPAGGNRGGGMNDGNRRCALLVARFWRL